MIFKRITYDTHKRFPRVSGFCRYCKSPLKNKRLSWCDGWRGKCYNRAMAESHWPTMRMQVWQDSGGKCAKCGFDIAAMMAELSRYNQEARKHTKEKYNFQEASRQTEVYARTMYGARGRAWPNDCWNADHIRPIVEGGECLDIKNVRILDLVCHDQETAALAKRRAERRKRHRFLPLFTETP